MKKWKCTICGAIFESEAKPEVCPICGVGAEFIEEVPEEADDDVPLSGDAPKKVVIAGGGPAAYSAAETLVRNGGAGVCVTLVAKENIPPYQRPMLSDVVAGTLAPSELPLADADWYAKHGVALVYGTAVGAKNGSLLLENGSELPFDALIVATGSNPFNPLGNGGGIPVHALRTLKDAEALIALAGKKLAVIGGGILGLEAAKGLLARGCDVTVFELSDRLMPKQCTEAQSQELASALEAAGIAVRTGVSAGAVEGEEIRLTDGSLFAADAVLVSIGVRSELTLARALGLAINRGIVVDAAMRTSAANIYAAGDCAEFAGAVPGRYGVAAEQGKVAALTVLGASASYEPKGAPMIFKIGDYTLRA